MTKQYRDGGKLALNNVTLGLNEGIFALLGPKRAGKTTLISIIVICIYTLLQLL